jgi:hypothetical protein
MSHFSEYIIFAPDLPSYTLSILGMGGVGIKENDGGGEFNYDIL